MPVMQETLPNGWCPPTPNANAQYFSSVDYLETWRAMEELQASGRVRALGVANFNCQQLQRLLDHSTSRPAVVHVRLLCCYVAMLLCSCSCYVAMLPTPLKQSTTSISLGCCCFLINPFWFSGDFYLLASNQ